MIEKASNIRFHDVADAFLLHRSPQSIQAGMLVAFRTVPGAAVLEYGLVDGFQHMP